MDAIIGEILSRAVTNLADTIVTGDEIGIEIYPQGGLDGVITILGYPFACEVKRSVVAANYNSVISQIKNYQGNMPVLLVAGKISRTLMKQAIKDGVNVLDAAGNCEIRVAGTPLFLSISGHSDAIKMGGEGIAFRSAGLKVLFYLLQDPANVGKPYRTIKEETGVSLGTVKNVIDSLEDQYILISSGVRYLKNKKELLDQWVINYNRTLKPKLFLGRMNFIGGYEKQWDTIKLPEGMCWGGECASYILDGYLYPERYEIYSTVPSNTLTKAGCAIPSADGNIQVYKKFWLDDTSAPALLVYADLMGSGDGRCREEAQRIYDRELSYLK